MLYGTSNEDIFPYANFSFETIWFTLHCPFLFLAIIAGDNITESEKFHRNSHNQELIDKMQLCDISGYPMKEVARGPGLAPPSAGNEKQLMWEHELHEPTQIASAQLLTASGDDGGGIRATASARAFSSEMCLLTCYCVEVLGYPAFEVPHFLTLTSHSHNLLREVHLECIPLHLGPISYTTLNAQVARAEILTVPVLDIQGKEFWPPLNIWWNFLWWDQACHPSYWFIPEVKPPTLLK